MATKKAKESNEQIINITPIKTAYATITIEGDTDIVLNKMNDVNKEDLIAERKGLQKAFTPEENLWRGIITSIHWYNGDPEEYTEKSMEDALKNNAPCITGFGLKKSFGDAVVRNEIDTYSTKFHNGMNVIAKGDLIPIKFAEHFIDERLMQPTKGKPVLVRLNRFTGWSASFQISYTGKVFSLEQIVQVINLAGFGLGIGSGRSSGYGRYHVVDVK